MADQEQISTDAPPDEAPLSGTRAEAIQRLQVGVVGLFAMVLVMGVASAISNRAAVTEEGAVPDAAATIEPTGTATPSDPLADAGVVPVVPADGEGGKAEGAGEAQQVPDIEPDARRNAPERN